MFIYNKKKSLLTPFSHLLQKGLQHKYVSSLMAHQGDIREELGKRNLQSGLISSILITLLISHTTHPLGTN